MKKMLMLLVVLVFTYGCGPNSVTISDESLEKLDAAAREEAIVGFWNNILDETYTAQNSFGFDSLKYNKITTYEAIGVTTPSYVYFDPYKIEKNDGKYTVYVRTLYKNIYDKNTEVCSSELGNAQQPIYSDDVYKNILSDKKVAKLVGKIYYKNWKGTDNGGLYASEEKIINISKSFNEIGSTDSLEGTINTGIGRDAGNTSTICVYRNDDVVWSYQVGYIKDIYIKKDELNYYTIVGKNYEKKYTMYLVKNNGTYRVSMSESFN